MTFFDVFDVFDVFGACGACGVCEVFDDPADPADPTDDLPDPIVGERPLSRCRALSGRARARIGTAYPEHARRSWPRDVRCHRDAERAVVGSPEAELVRFGQVRSGQVRAEVVLVGSGGSYGSGQVRSVVRIRR
ncbi:hypothetical protein [Streptomyces sp. DSM 40484]|uniref:hypothetical protein n=1 Tax=Streptomyces kroppenstedtii TaxID=3051181 RepID=UPI0028D86085|nr:hypothetical protein [Streptomyces sp. DSM 40484]